VFVRTNPETEKIMQTRILTESPHVRPALADLAMRRPQRHGYADAITLLGSYGYGQISARGMLALADIHGSWNDGSTTITLHESGNGYYVTQD